LRNIQALLDMLVVLEDNIEIAKIYGEIKSDLKSKGKPIPENDIWIASIARFYNLTLLTKDNHFNEVTNMSLELLPR